MRLSFEEIVRAVDGSAVAGAAPCGIVEGVGTDSRAVKPGSLFVCIPGETFDGHDFAVKAIEAGAAALLVSRNPFDAVPPVPLILVEDTVKALGKLAHCWRERLGETRVIGLTGTAGKTTVKELLAQVLSRRGLTAKTHMNLNNQIGLPLSMLAATGEEAFWVMEAGISHPNDMDELGAILEPDLALILNVGPGHAAGLGDRGTAHYKSKLLAHLAPGGTAIISADYPDLAREARAVRQELVFFSTSGRQVDYRAAYVVPAGEDKGLFRLWLDGVSIDVEAPFRGAFGAENVIAVAAVAHRLGLGWSSTTATTPTRCLFPGCWRPPLKWPGITRTGPLCACSAKWANSVRFPRMSTAIWAALWRISSPALSAGRAGTWKNLKTGCTPDVTEAHSAR